MGHSAHDVRQRRWAKRLLKNKVRDLIEETRREYAGQSKKQARAVRKTWGYFVRNAGRMQYGTYWAEGYFMGSGAVEAGCKTVIDARGKQSGMFWSKSGAQNIRALCCIHTSR